MTIRPPHRPSRHALARPLALALALTAPTLACDALDTELHVGAEASPDDEADDDLSTGVSLSSIEYILAFSWGDAEPLDGGGWATVNDLGYRVEIEAGYLASYSASLSPCTPVDTSASNTTASLSERVLGGLLVPTTAFAGHAEAADPSQIEAPRIEDLANPTESTFGAAEFELADYCWAHYLAAGTDEATASLPTDADMDGVTLYLEGTVWLDENSAEPIMIQTTTASGVLEGIDLESLEAAVEGEHGTLTITRDLAHAFDGFDFATDDPADLDRIVLRHLVQEAAVGLHRSAVD